VALPHLLVIGAQKATMTWLWRNLGAHLGASMPPFKKLHYFDELHIPNNRACTARRIANGVKNSLKRHCEPWEQPDLDHAKYLLGLASNELFAKAWYASALDWNAADGKLLGTRRPSTA
jgi:hypothetical protein